MAVAIAKSIIVAEMNEPLRMPYNSIVSFDPKESPDSATINLQFVYRGKGASSISLLEVSISGARSTFDIEHTS
jgi:hypothetical protein